MYHPGDLEERIRRIEQEIDALPVMAGGGGGASDQTLLYVGANNELAGFADGFGPVYGCAVPVSPVTEVPVTTPSTFTIYADGICSARVVSNGTLGATVWIGNYLDDGTNTYQDLPYEVIYRSFVISRTSIQLPITGGGGATATVYLPWIDGIGSAL